MDYTVNDALNILWRCGIKTVPNLLKHLQLGEFQIAESTLYRKLKILESDGMIIDRRITNKGSRSPDK